MARSTHTDHAKCTVWTPNIKAEISGPRIACSIEIFRTLRAEQMERAIAKMQEIHARTVEREAAANEPRHD